MNVITIVGRATKDPIVRKTKYGDICYLTVAVGAKNSRTDYFNVALKDGACERCSQHVKKGDLVTVQGSVHLNQWGNNNEYAALAITSKHFEFFGKRMETDSNSENENTSVSYDNASPNDFEEVDDYDMPF